MSKTAALVLLASAGVARAESLIATQSGCTCAPVSYDPGNASAHAGSMKALLDFFLLTETDVLASNCAYVCSGGRCGNTYM